MKIKKLTAIILCLVTAMSVFVVDASFSSDGNENQFEIENLSMGGGGAFFLPLVNPTDSKNFIVTSDMNGVYTSFNEGESWSRTETKGVVRDNCFSEDGTLFTCGYGVYKSTDKGLSLERIYPKNTVYEISRYGWNENLFFTAPEEDFDNGYVVTVETYGDSVYFVTVTWDGMLKVRSCDFSGDHLTTYFEKDYSTVSSDPTGMNIKLVADESGIYFSDMLEIRRISFDTKTVSQMYKAQKEILDFKKIEDTYFILDDIGTETLVLYTKDFGSYHNLNDKNTLKNSYTWEKTYTFPWRFHLIDGYSLDSIFLCVSTPVEDSYDFYGTVKFDGEKFGWVFDSVFENTITENSEDSWTRNCYGPIYGLCADRNDPDRCVMTNIEAVYSMSLDKNDVRKVRTLHTKHDEETDNYKSTGLNCQTTYSVQEDPFNSEHFIICSTDLGLQYTFDGGKTFNRQTKRSFSPIYNTCYDLFFDENRRDVVYGLWSSRHDAPYAPSLSDKTDTEGRFGVSLDGGVTWNLDYSSGLPEESIPVRMSAVRNGDQYTIAVATFNCGFFISYDSGKTFESVSGEMDSYQGFIWGEDVILSGDKMYCLTAYYNFGEVAPSRLYEVDLSSGQTKQIDLGSIVIARSLTLSDYGLFVNALPTYRYAWYNEYASGFWKNEGGGIYRLNDDDSLTNIFDLTKTYTVDTFNRNDWAFSLDGKTYQPGDRIYIENAVLEEGDSIYNSIVSEDGTIYATGIYGTVYVKENGSDHFRIYVDGLFTVLKNLSLSRDGKTLYVSTFGGGLYRMPSIKALNEEPSTEPTTEPITEPTTEPTTQPTTEPTTESTTQPTTEPATQPTAQPTTETATNPATRPEASKCTHICHQGGFSGFIYKIMRFFWKLFGINRVCECGEKHY